jgi:hypothetical protein
MKCFIYCTKAKPYLVEPKELCDEQDEYGITNEDCISGIALNGSIVAVCEVKEAVQFKYSGDGDYWWYRSKSSEHFTGDLLKRSALSESGLFEYGQGYPLYFYYLENVVPVNVRLLYLYKDEACSKFLTKAPQSYRFAYKFNEITSEDDDHYQLIKGEKVLVLSIRSQYCAAILNGEKDLEVRKQRIKGASIK